MLRNRFCHYTRGAHKKGEEAAAAAAGTSCAQGRDKGKVDGMMVRRSRNSLTGIKQWWHGTPQSAQGRYFIQSEVSQVAGFCPPSANTTRVNHPMAAT